MEQMDLIFETPPQKAEQAKPDYEHMADTELTELYQEKVRIDPTHRYLSRAELIAGVTDPEAERSRIKALDEEDDKRELKSNYTRH